MEVSSAGLGSPLLCQCDQGKQESQHPVLPVVHPRSEPSPVWRTLSWDTCPLPSSDLEGGLAALLGGAQGNRIKQPEPLEAPTRGSIY